ncbi:hypothetical protein BEP19_03585 [Ammoniphilus oxalaticus]|uniref:Diguanylate cyclase n=1 Tax=Ammoniphilus oxalaticus TaxID=66863 RepID=A0A419SP02_9BACL|nr:GGDEF domain-containing protein [Ammoniphilus oxalaticus]RKD26018.1 hypothetical protein BEP19_03585 [Ammoniphilus oxalaticus]
MFNDTEFFINAFLQAPKGMALVSIEGSLIKANQMFCKLLGYEQAELDGMSLRELMDPSDFNYERHQLEQLLAGSNSIYEAEQGWIDKQGRSIRIQQAVSIGGSGERLFYIFQLQLAVSLQEKSLTPRDLEGVLTKQALPDEQKFLEAELGQYRTRLRQILSVANIGTSLVDLKGNIMEADEVLQQMFGYTEQQLKEKTFYEITHPDDVHLNQTLYEELIAGKRDNYHLEKRYIRSDGHVIWGDLTVCINRQESPTITAMIKDITERKQLENHLQESEERFRMIAEYVSDVISIRDHEGRYTYLSAASYPLLGYREDELLGQSAIQFIHPEDRDSFLKEYDTLMKTGQVLSTYRFCKKDGNYFWVESKLRVFHQVNNEIKIIAISRDITRHKKREQELQETQRLWQQLSTIDGVTEIYNRRHFDETIRREWSRCRRNGHPISLVLLDIDFFKDYNDTYGHLKGDVCLKLVAQTIKRTVQRQGDQVFRYGGEEFAALLPETDERGANEVAERMRLAIMQSKISHRKSPISPYVTISVGYATSSQKAKLDIQQLMLQADQALYLAKNQGRNKVSGMF